MYCSSIIQNTTQNIPSNRAVQSAWLRPHAKNRAVRPKIQIKTHWVMEPESPVYSGCTVKQEHIGHRWLTLVIEH